MSLHFLFTMLLPTQYHPPAGLCGNLWLFTCRGRRLDDLLTRQRHRKSIFFAFYAFSMPFCPHSCNIFTSRKICYNSTVNYGERWKWWDWHRSAMRESLSASMQSSNGKGKTTEESIRASLLTNRREVVIVADGNGGRLAGFVCVQLKKSFCYDEYMPEITEVYVRPEYRGRGVAREMLIFAQEYCKKYTRSQLRAVDGQR